MKTTASAYKSGFVVLTGRPNVGKSTFVNALLGQKIAAVTPRPQTTRRKQLGILTLEEAQIILIDTPGIHQPVHKLGEFMNETAIETLNDADIILWMVDSSSRPCTEDELCARSIQALNHVPPVIIGLNKIDLLPPSQIDKREEEFLALLPGATVCQLSSTRGKGINQLMRKIIEFLPEGEPYYDEEQVTDYYERDIAVDLIREAALIFLRDEVPHCLAVRLDEFKERENMTSYIMATLFVEKESQKGIVIGKNGEMLKKIGTAARQEIEEMTGRKVFLELRVKTSQNWRNTPQALKMMGFSREN